MVSAYGEPSSAENALLRRPTSIEAAFSQDETVTSLRRLGADVHIQVGADGSMWSCVILDERWKGHTSSNRLSDIVTR